MAWPSLYFRNLFWKISKKKKIVAIKFCLLKHYFEQEKQGKVMQMFNNEVNH